MMTRRRFLSGAAVLGATDVLAATPRLAHAQPRLETTQVRLGGPGGTCNAPKWVAEELLRAEGFTDVHYANIELSTDRRKALNSGDIDFDVFFAPDLIIAVDAAQPLTILAGLHVGCLEIVGTERVRTIRDLKGKAIAVREIGETEHQFLAVILRYIGLDPNKDVRLVAHKPEEGAQLLAEGRVDALIGFPPRPQELHAKKIGHAVLNGTTDPPWRDHFCCMVAGNRQFVRRHPAATKRVLRALMKANDLCAIDPTGVAKLVSGRNNTSYDYAAQTMKELPYGKWRDYDAEATIRFYALRLHEAGLIKSSPQKILAQGADWRFLNELKRELKG
jgi:NitT/TauT family transport system substrate-binding protein